MSETIGDVSVEVGDDHVATVEIHRPPSNFFDVALIRRLAEVFSSFDDDHGVRAIVLCSEGRHFCAGADFNAQLGRALAEEGAGDLYREAVRLFDAKTPSVAAVQGAAIGGGLGLACAADFRVACPEARFAANFARLGFHQGFGLSITLPAIVGQQRALGAALYRPAHRRDRGGPHWSRRPVGGAVRAAGRGAPAGGGDRRVGPLAVASIRRETSCAAPSPPGSGRSRSGRTRSRSVSADRRLRRGHRRQRRPRDPVFEGR